MQRHLKSTNAPQRMPGLQASEKGNREKNLALSVMKRGITIQEINSKSGFEVY